MNGRRFEVTVRPGAKQNRVEKTPEGNYRVWVKAPPREGKANEALVAVLSEHFGIPKSNIAVLRGRQSKLKTVELRSA